ncbi:neutral zinc metallopeptidase, partial [Amycolatopsis magusensis]
MDAAWHPAFTARALSFQLPTRIFWTEPGRGPCGDYPGDAAAYYCWANHGIYLGAADDEHRMVLTAILAHEYGHHVQEDAGILEYGHQLMAGSAATACDEASRRIELQAQCFAGAFLSAQRDSLPITSSQYRAVLADARARGDDGQPDDRRDHGSGAHYAGWVARGYTQYVLSSCNTWTA